ncbi:hypothetical protein ABFX02_01G025600 [Erythranthe guttata]
MLRKRTRSHQRDQHMNNSMPDSVSESYFHSDTSTQKHKNDTFTKAPGLFVGFNPKSSESDSVRSPTSPLDFRIFSGLGNPFRCPKTQNEGCVKSWGCSKVGLSIIDSLDTETKQAGEFNRPSENKNILFGRQVNIPCPIFCSHEKTNSLPKDVAAFSKRANVRKGDSSVVFEIGEASFEPESNGATRACSMDSSGRYLKNFGNRKSRFGSGNLVRENVNVNVNVMNPTPLESGFIIPASEIELSEDYTCVITHGPNPKVTHIYGDCILERHKDENFEFFKKIDDGRGCILERQKEEKIEFFKKIEDGGASNPLDDDFLKFCYSCHKNLDGEDIYMYRGEKAFCSSNCRSLEIENDEKTEKANTDSSEISDSCEEFSGSSSLFITAA